METLLSAALPVIVLMLMINLGLELTPADFRRVMRQPKLMGVGLFGQMALLPVVGIAVVHLHDLPRDIAVGMLLLAVAPGGLTSNLLTRYAGGDVALSISLTAVASLLSAISVPVLFPIMLYLVGESGIGGVSMLRTSVTMFGIVTIPVMAGMAVRAFAPGFTSRNAARFRVIAITLLTVALGLSMVHGLNEVRRFFALAGVAAVTMNLAMMTLAYVGPRLFGIGHAQRVAISIECGLQNVTLALALVTLIGLPAAVAVPAQIYAVIMLVSATAFMLVLNRARPAERTGA